MLPSPHVTSKVGLKVPLAVGVPEINPVVASKSNPGGRFPEVIA